ncbi:hypothetical protein K458DRAFT_407331 [Lentithecium fluviatile CBS 122367]|uniref:DNA-directed RNA polymerase subunit n=1 Tax=Lentithecium fluviatile CBS 122367 TaxID=1168545 RepID=A0A6G1IQQ6_9PLEO|nr:hypothetical protein K458DRAFT_407331 [Lentithecium fluviatile CBS 122367]
MLLFCPTCSSMLRVTKIPPGDPSTEQYVGQNRFECLTCPYQFILKKRYYERKMLRQKEVDDVIGGAGSWDNVDKVKVQCPNEKCRNDEAYWYALQIRSADEPMTNFYKCTKCSKQWRD